GPKWTIIAVALAGRREQGLEQRQALAARHDRVVDAEVAWDTCRGCASVRTPWHGGSQRRLAREGLPLTKCLLQLSRGIATGGHLRRGDEAGRTRHCLRLLSRLERHVIAKQLEFLSWVHCAIPSIVLLGYPVLWALSSARHSPQCPHAGLLREMHSRWYYGTIACKFLARVGSDLATVQGAHGGRQEEQWQSKIWWF